MKRLPEVTLQLWGSLLKPRGYEISGGALVRSPSKKTQSAPREPPASPAKTSQQQRKNAGPNNGSVISSFRRANSFAQVQKDMTAPRQPFRRTLTSVLQRQRGDMNGSFSVPEPLGAGDKSSSGPSTSAVAGPSSSSSSGTLFTGLRFRALGEAKSATVRSAVEQYGGNIVSDAEADEDVDFVVVRLVR